MGVFKGIQNIYKSESLLTLKWTIHHNMTSQLIIQW